MNDLEMEIDESTLTYRWRDPDRSDDWSDWADLPDECCSIALEWRPRGEHDSRHIIAGSECACCGTATFLLFGPRGPVVRRMTRAVMH